MSLVRDEFEGAKRQAQEARARVAAKLMGSDSEFAEANAAYEAAVQAADQAWARVLSVEPDASVVAGMRLEGTPGVGESLHARIARIARRERLG